MDVLYVNKYNIVKRERPKNVKGPWGTIGYKLVYSNIIKVNNQTIWDLLFMFQLFANHSNYIKSKHICVDFTYNATV